MCARVRLSVFSTLFGRKLSRQLVDGIYEHQTSKGESNDQDHSYGRSDHTTRNVR